LKFSEGCSGDVRKHPFSGGGIDNNTELYIIVLRNTSTKCKTEKNV